MADDTNPTAQPADPADSTNRQTVDISADPADYMSGPTGSMTSRTQGGTTQDGTISVVGYDGDTDQPDHGTPAGPGTDLAQ